LPHDNDKIAALIGSRICHDLISPVGAVANGLELLELSGMPKGPELSVVTESATSATARLRFFRLAFGEADDETRLPAAEVAAIVAATHAESRTRIDWRVTGAPLRAEVKAALLALLCAEQALTKGGQVTIAQADGCWRILAQAERLSPDRALWAMLEGAPAPDPVRADAVQFILLPRVLARQDRNCTVQISENRLEIAF